MKKQEQEQDKLLHFEKSEGVWRYSHNTKIPIKILTLDCHPRADPRKMTKVDFIDFLRLCKAPIHIIEWVNEQPLYDFRSIWQTFNNPGEMMWILDRFDMEAANCTKHMIILCCCEIIDFYFYSMSPDDEPLSFTHSIREFLNLRLRLDDFQEIIETVNGLKEANKGVYSDTARPLDLSKSLFFQSTETLMEYAVSDFVTYRTENTSVRDVVNGIVDAFGYYAQHKTMMPNTGDTWVYARAKAKKHIAQKIKDHFVF